MQNETRERKNDYKKLDQALDGESNMRIDAIKVMENKIDGASQNLRDEAYERNSKDDNLENRVNGINDNLISRVNDINDHIQNLREEVSSVRSEVGKFMNPTGSCMGGGNDPLPGALHLCRGIDVRKSIKMTK